MRKYFITSKMQPGGLHFFVISQRPGKITVISIDSSYGFSISAVRQNRLVSLQKTQMTGKPRNHHYKNIQVRHTVCVCSPAAGIASWTGFSYVRKA